MSDNQHIFLFLVISFKKENNNKDNDMINDYTIYDTADMYIKRLFLYMKLITCIQKRQIVYMFVIIYIVL